MGKNSGNPGGWMGRILRIDLTGMETEIQASDPHILKDYLGGRGFGARILYDEAGKAIAPLDRNNLLIFAAGPLTGTTSPASGRFSVTTKSPLTGTITDANSGGKWGVLFKKSGFDALIVTGRAESPVYLTIQDDRVEIKPADKLWGRDVFAVTDELKRKEGGDPGILCIGPAGENQVLFASIMNEKHRALARGGVGAVMGSKNLKAVVVKGTRKIGIADRERMKFVTYEANKWVRASPLTSKALPEFGTSVLVHIINEAGIFPVRNFQESYCDTADRFSGETISEEILEKKTGCWGCIIQCGRRTRTASGAGEGPEYESNWALGSNCGIDDLTVITEANYLCNRMGLDTMSTGGTIACAMELGENGILNPGFKFGDKHKLLDVIEKIALRKGIGDELALGSKRFSERYKAGEYAMQVKGQELAAYDPRGAQGQGLAYAVSNRGGCHLRGGYVIGPELLGVPRMADRFSSVGKAGLAVRSQDLGAAVDSLVVCRFATFALNEYVWARLLSAVTGEFYLPQDVLRAGERIFTLERLYNLREGFSREDDTLPGRLLKEAVKAGPAKGYKVNLPPMLDEFFSFRGWDRQGVPTPRKLEELGLEE